MIYVDSPKTYPWTSLRYKTWSHMWSDTGHTGEGGEFRDDELHAMADRLGLKRAWWQFNVGPGATEEMKRRKSHYDVTPPKRALALRYGAVAMELADFYRMKGMFGLASGATEVAR